MDQLSSQLRSRHYDTWKKFQNNTDCLLSFCFGFFSQITDAVVPTHPARRQRSSLRYAGITSAAAHKVKSAHTWNSAWRCQLFFCLLIITRRLLRLQIWQSEHPQQRTRDVCLQNFTPRYDALNTHTHHLLWSVKLVRENLISSLDNCQWIAFAVLQYEGYT